MKTPDLEHDILACEWMVDKIKNSHEYAQHLYAAMCNNEFQCNQVVPILKDMTWCCSWRYAGGIVGGIRGEDYIDFYCSGMTTDTLVAESTVTQEVRDDLFELGWVVVDQGN